MEEKKKVFIDDDVLTDREKHFIKMSFIKKIKNDKTRMKIMTAAFAHQDDVNEDGALESMIYYLMNNKSEIDKYYKMALGGIAYIPENGKPEMMSEQKPEQRKKGKNKK